MSVAPTPVSSVVAPGRLAESVADEVAAGGRFAALVATARADDSTVLRAVVAHPGRLSTIEAVLDPGTKRYPALTPLVPPAAWYEREIRDLFGVEPVGHPRPDPLVLPLAADDPRPRPGHPAEPSRRGAERGRAFGTRER